MVHGNWKGHLLHSVLNDTDMVVWTLDQMVGVEAGREGTKKGNNIPPKSRAQLFSLKRRAFFSEPDEVPIGHPGEQSGTSVTYIKDYHNAIKENPDQAKYLKDALDIIFQHLQILPFNPGRLADPKHFWLVEGDKIMAGGSTGSGRKESW